ncbi:hypothetical protein [Marinobacterium aestuariivivens]|uniref:Uncharacterized protein n=1 Tax=Marinobacterium aestuariivivens TaxID=1698799 RepID=A0ABW1ZSV0_9GAMM
MYSAQQMSDINLEEVMAAARMERARMIREFLVKLGQRQIQPFWNNAFKPLFLRFSH